MIYIVHYASNSAIRYADYDSYDSVVSCATKTRGHGVSKIESEGSEARTRSLRWMESLWEGTGTTVREENRKEEVLALFRELARESRREWEVREYTPWVPLW